MAWIASLRLLWCIVVYMIYYDATSLERLVPQIVLLVFNVNVLAVQKFLSDHVDLLRNLTG